MERGVLPVAHKATLSDYFMAIDKRLENLLEHQVSLLARIRDYTVRMIFPCMEYARYAVPDMFVIPDTGGGQMPHLSGGKIPWKLMLYRNMSGRAGIFFK